MPRQIIATPTDTESFTRALEDSGRFRRDTGLGDIYHRGKISFRELRQTDSLHVVVHGNRISAHVDRISPLKNRRDGSVGYSLARVVAHNLSGIGADLGRRLGGRHGTQRCTLDCELVWVDDGLTAAEPCWPAEAVTAIPASSNGG